MLLDDGIIHTNNGLKHVKDISFIDSVQTNDGYDELERIRHKFDHIDAVTVITQDGEFHCTSDQYVAVLKDCTEHKWKMAKDLKADDVLVTSRRPIDGTKTHFMYMNNIEMTAQIAWLLGIVHSKDHESYDDDHIKWKFDKEDYKVALRMHDMLHHLEDILGLEHPANIDMIYTDMHYIVSTSHTKDLLGEHFSLKRIPCFIKNAQLDVRLGYISGIIDGNIHARSLSADNRRAFKICKMHTSEIDFVRSIQILCYSCGFETHFSIATDYVTLAAITRHSLNTLINIPTLIKYADVNTYLDTNMYLRNVNSFPASMVRGKNKFGRRFLYNLGIHKLKNITMDVYDQFFGNIAYCPVKVKRVVTCEINADVFDISLKNKEEYYCNGYLVKAG